MNGTEDACPGVFLIGGPPGGGPLRACVVGSIIAPLFTVVGGKCFGMAVDALVNESDSPDSITHDWSERPPLSDMTAGAPANPDDPDMENDSPCDDPEDMSCRVVNTADNLRTGPDSGPFRVRDKPPMKCSDLEMFFVPGSQSSW